MANSMSLYMQRGVSPQKEDVHKATEKLDKGLFPFAFCKIYEDYLVGDPDWVNLMHADGAGTKSILAYLHWRETGDLSIWRGIAQDAVAMNLDDLLCVGIYDKLLFSSTIDRNKNAIPGEILSEIINGTQSIFNQLKTFGVNIEFLGGETADVGDLVRTIAVNGTMTARWPKDRLITNEKIQAGDVIVGISSSGQSTYETTYNSGIGSNGLTSARHDVLSRHYANKHTDSYDSRLPDNVVYIGKNLLEDTVPVRGAGTQTIASLLLSPTRTYAPYMKQVLEQYFDDIHGLVHCSGGGQTKCLKYLHSNFRIVKDNVFEAPEIFKIIQASSGSDNREMYQVFNMGHRLEIFTTEQSANGFIRAAEAFKLDAQVVGRVEAADKKELVIKLPGEEILYQ